MRHLTLALTLAIGLAPLSRADILFTFDPDPVPQHFNFTDTVDGLSATFSGTGVNECNISSLGFVLESGNAVITGTCPTEPSGHEIDIGLSSVVQNVTMDFATPGEVPLTLTAYLDGNPVGSSVEAGTKFKYFEGVISFGSPFDSLALTTDDEAISIDNLDFNVTTPEPTFAIPLAGIVAAIGVLAAKRRRAAVR